METGREMKRWLFLFALLLAGSAFGHAPIPAFQVRLTNGNNTLTAIASDSYGRKDTNSITVNLPALASYVYDLNGNLTTNGTRVFEYDDENQLVRITEPNAWKSEFTYDGMMRRRITKEYAWVGGAWALTGETRYVYDGRLVVQERDGNNAALVAYTRGRDLSGSRQGAGGIGGLLARSELSSLNLQPATSYYHSDGGGNVTMLINGNQTVTAKYLYDPFGGVLSKSGSLADANSYQWSSKEVHQPSGSVYYLYRPSG